MPEERTWTIRVCAECGEPVGSASTGHRHKPPRNGIYSYADVREVAVAPLASLEAAESRCEELEEALRDFLELSERHGLGRHLDVAIAEARTALEED